MNDYKELIKETRGFANRLRYYVDEDVPYMEWEIEAVEDAADAIERLVKERNAAIADLKINWLCAVCKNRVVTKEWMACKNKDFYEAPCGAPTCLNFEWRGVHEQERECDGAD